MKMNQNHITEFMYIHLGNESEVLSTNGYGMYKNKLSNQIQAEEAL